ncbi:MAG TPA: DMT family transporter [Verrucomicrobiae bacterium]|nr:DMT family transporter [Verrucomicrobiae bacterium]
MQSQSQTNPLPWLVLTTLLWGGSFVFNKIGFREIHPVTFLFLRFAAATLLMGVICLPRLRRLDRTILRRGAAVGSALAAANLTFVLGVAGTSVSRAGFLNNLFVLIVPAMSIVLWKERPDRFLACGVALAATGLFFLAWGGSGGFSRGDMLSTLCSLFIALHIVMVSRVLGDEDVYLVTLVQFATVAVVGGILTLLLRAPLPVPGPVSLGALAYCAIFPTTVCFTIQNTFQRFTSPTVAGLVYTLDPVWSALGGMLLLGERLAPLELGGCVLILAGVVTPTAARLAADSRRVAPAGG